MKRIQLYLLLSVVVFATGCPKYKPQVNFDKNANTFINKLNTFISAKHQEYKNALGNSPEGAKRARNEALEEVLPYIDAAYMDFITDIQAGRDRTNFVADLIDLGTSAAVGITNGERPLQILGVALTAFRGGRRSADLNFFKEQSTPVLISKMDGNRAKVRATILTREKEEASTYPFGAAISDIVEYYNAGTLVRAFTELQKDTAVQTKESEDELTEIKKRAGVVGAVTIDQMDVASLNTKKLEGLAESFETSTKDITDAGNQLTAADAQIAAADKQIEDADKENPPNATKKSEAEKVRATATAARDAATAKRDAATGVQKAALDNMKRVYQLIEADQALRPFLDKIVERFGKDSPTLKARIEQSLKRLKEKNPADPPTGQDYSLILQLFGGVIVENLPQDITLRDRWKAVLTTIQ